MHDTRRHWTTRNEINSRIALIKHKKFFLPPPEGDSNFKQLFRRTAAAGVGRPVDGEGFPIGHWTPELLAEAISTINANDTGVDLRTVQHWFQDNDKGISLENLRWLARIFGCGDPDATSAWHSALSSSHTQFLAQRRTNRKLLDDQERKYDEPVLQEPLDADPSSPEDLARSDNSKDWRNRFSFAQTCEALFSNQSNLNLPTVVWAGFMTLGILAYIMGVHHVTYTPIDGLDKQIGYFWAPNWTILELVLLPLFLIIVVDLLAYWKRDGRPLLLDFNQKGQVASWERGVRQFSPSHWANFFVCFVVVFLLQWSGVYLIALISGETGNLMVDWAVVAVLRPEVISVPEAIVLSMLAFLYTAVICFLFLSGLILLCTVAHDFSRVSDRQEASRNDANHQELYEAGNRLMNGFYRCAVLGILIATCIKLQATYLLSDGENIVLWLTKDALHALGFVDTQSKWFEQRALAHFTSSLLVFVTCAMFLYCFTRVDRALSQMRSSDVGRSPDNHTLTSRRRRFRWGAMLATLIVLVLNFILLGYFSGFSILLAVATAVAAYGLYDPMFGCVKAGYRLNMDFEP